MPIANYGHLEPRASNKTCFGRNKTNKSTSSEKVNNYLDCTKSLYKSWLVYTTHCILTSKYQEVQYHELMLPMLHQKMGIFHRLSISLVSQTHLIHFRGKWRVVHSTPPGSLSTSVSHFSPEFPVLFSTVFARYLKKKCLCVFAIKLKDMF